MQQHHDQSLIVEGVAFPSQYSVELKNLSSVANDITNTDDDGRNSIEKPSENDGECFVEASLEKETSRNNVFVSF